MIHQAQCVFVVFHAMQIMCASFENSISVDGGCCLPSSCFEKSLKYNLLHCTGIIAKSTVGLISHLLEVKLRCYVCCKRGGAMSCWHGFMIHAKVCHSKIRARQGQQRKGAPHNYKKLYDNDIELATKNPEAWRVKLQGHGGDNQARAQARALAKSEAASSSYNRQEQVSGQVLEEGDQILTKISLRNFALVNYEMSKKDADTWFDELLQEQGSEYQRPNGEDRVLIENPNALIKKWHGRQSAEGVMNQTEIDDEEASRERRRVMATTIRQPRSSRGRSRSPKRSPSRTDVQRSNEGKAHSAGSNRSRAGGGDGSPQRVSRRSSPPDLPSAKKKRPAADETDGAQLLRATADCKLKIEGMIALLDGAKTNSLSNQLESISEVLKEKRMDQKQLPHSPEQVATSVSSLAVEAKSLLKKVLTCISMHALEGFVVLADELQESVSGLEKKVKQLNDAVKYKRSLAATDKRSEYQTKRWLRTKIAGHLSSGGHCPGVAKHMADVLAYCKENDEALFIPRTDKACSNWAVDPLAAAFDQQIPTIWVSKGAESEGFADKFRKLVAGQKAVLDDSQSALHTKLNEERQWAGSVGCVKGFNVDWENFEPLKWAKGEPADVCAWLVSCRMNGRRCGPTAVPSPGLPMVISPLTHDLVVHISFAHHVLNSGIVLTNFDKFASSDAGAQHLSQAGFTVRAQVGSMIFVPAGCIVALAWYMEPGKKRRSAAEVAEEFADVIIVPTIGEKSLDGVSLPVKTAMYQWNKDALKNKTLDMWKARMDLLTREMCAPE